ncbi:MAG TPA: hypothetical protein VFF76_00385 [Holophagaceae bacterium]|jgi:hypothetical protein|nr:hypothetical protein [Holophagaceae bacterium]
MKPFHLHFCPACERWDVFTRKDADGQRLCAETFDDGSFCKGVIAETKAFIASRKTVDLLVRMRGAELERRGPWAALAM